MKLCLICLQKITGNSSKYCFDCGCEIDKRFTTELAKAKANLRKIIVNKMIVENAAKLENSKHINQQVQVEICAVCGERGGKNACCY